MKSVRLRQLLSEVLLAVTRLGVVRSVAVLLGVAGVLGWSWGMPHLRAKLQVQQKAVAQARAAQQTPAAAPAVQRTPDEERLTHFYSNLGERSHVEQQLKSLFAIANKNSLVLNQAEYKSAFDKNGRFYTYQISLPVKGPYAAIRQFCEQTLLAIPFASLDEMSFKRETVGTRMLEAKLRFTLYLASDEVQPPVASRIRNSGDD